MTALEASNEKIERLLQIYEKHRWRFGIFSEFFIFYNVERLHMSLDWDTLKMPAEAFERLMPSPAKGDGYLLATEVTANG